jgi:hypothetical protein
MPDSYTNLLYHIVFSTKDRRPIIAPEYEPRIYYYIGGTIRSLVGGTIRSLGGICLELAETSHFLRFCPNFCLTWQTSLLKSARFCLDSENAPSHKCGALTLLDPHKIDQRNLFGSSPTVREGSAPFS